MTHPTIKEAGVIRLCYQIEAKGNSLEQDNMTMLMHEAQTLSFLFGSFDTAITSFFFL